MISNLKYNRISSSKRESDGREQGNALAGAGPPTTGGEKRPAGSTRPPVNEVGFKRLRDRNAVQIPSPESMHRQPSEADEILPDAV